MAERLSTAFVEQGSRRTLQPDDISINHGKDRKNCPEEIRSQSGIKPAEALRSDVHDHEKDDNRGYARRDTTPIEPYAGDSLQTLHGNPT
jgi:hypothetical protein